MNLLFLSWWPLTWKWLYLLCVCSWTMRSTLKTSPFTLSIEIFSVGFSKVVIPCSCSVCLCLNWLHCNTLPQQRERGGLQTCQVVHPSSCLPMGIILPACQQCITWLICGPGLILRCRCPVHSSCRRNRWWRTPLCYSASHPQPILGICSSTTLPTFIHLPTCVRSPWSPACLHSLVLAVVFVVLFGLASEWFRWLLLQLWCLPSACCSQHSVLSKTFPVGLVYTALRQLDPTALQPHRPPRCRTLSRCKDMTPFTLQGDLGLTASQIMFCAEPTTMSSSPYL